MAPGDTEKEGMRSDLVVGAGSSRPSSTSRPCSSREKGKEGPNSNGGGGRSGDSEKKRGSASLILSASNPGIPRRPESDWAGEGQHALFAFGGGCSARGEAQPWAQVWDPDMSWAQWVEGGAAASILQGSIRVSDGAWLVWRRAGRWALGRKTGAYEWLVRPAAPPLSSLRAWQA